MSVLKVGIKMHTYLIISLIESDDLLNFSKEKMRLYIRNIFQLRF